MSKKGTLFVISGPSGAGKGTVREELFRTRGSMAYSVSCTTRAPREGERNGVEYFFVSDDEFQKLIDADEFLEWASVHKHRYGTLRSHVREVLESGRDMMLEIDVQGALQVKGRMPEAVTVFVAPPSFEELERRLRGRGTESEEQILTRMANARKEMQLSTRYDYVIVNDDLARTVSELSDLIDSHRQ